MPLSSTISASTCGAKEVWIMFISTFFLDDNEMLNISKAFVPVPVCMQCEITKSEVRIIVSNWDQLQPDINYCYDISSWDERERQQDGFDSHEATDPAARRFDKTALLKNWCWFQRFYIIFFTNDLQSVRIYQWTQITDWLSQSFNIWTLCLFSQCCRPFYN